MTKQKDRHLETPGEANRDKHINFVAEENGDVDPADDNSTDDEEGDDNGFFTDDDSELQTEKEHEEDKANKPGKEEKVTPLEYDDAPTLGDKITVNTDNEDLVTLVTDNDNDSFENEDDQAH